MVDDTRLELGFIRIFQLFKSTSDDFSPYSIIFGTSQSSCFIGFFSLKGQSKGVLCVIMSLNKPHKWTKQIVLSSNKPVSYHVPVYFIAAGAVCNL